MTVGLVFVVLPILRAALLPTGAFLADTLWVCEPMETLPYIASVEVALVLAFALGPLAVLGVLITRHYF